MQIGLSTRKLLKIETLEIQAGNQQIDKVVTSLPHSGYFFFTVMPYKSIISIK